VAFAFAAMCLIAPQAPLNAARADVLHPSLRGRGTSLDIVLQSTASAVAPVVVGVLADIYSLRTAFLVMAPLMLLSSLILFVAVATYVREERALRQQIRREVLGSGVAAELADDSDERRDGESAGQAAIRMARTGPTVAEGGDLLVVDDLDVAFGSVQVLFGAALRIPEGGVHAIVGRNGVGKTTLLNTIAGLSDGRRGRILYDGLDLTGVPADQRVRLGITLMGGGRSTFPTLTVEENIWIGAFPYHSHHSVVRERFDAVIEVFPALGDRLKQAGGTLSGGEQQMVALARALMAGPRLLMLDELSIGLAPVVTRSLLDVVQQIKRLGTTVIIVEQSVPNALSVADTVTFMDKGLIVPVGNASELGDGQVLVDMMIGAGTQ
jgi:branched-chain amino acid transport system ATP-binding protein